MSMMGRQALFDDRDKLKAHLAAARAEVAEAKESLAHWMIANSYATGHGDSFADLLKELGWQHKQQLAAERARVKELEADGKRLDWLESEMGREQAAISANGSLPRSLFRLNCPITRRAIDAAMPGSAERERRDA